MANDGKTNSAAAAVNITVRRVNQPPVVSAGPDQTILFPNPVRLGGKAATANPTAVTDGQASNVLTDKVGRLIVVKARLIKSPGPMIAASKPEQ